MTGKERGEIGVEGMRNFYDRSLGNFRGLFRFDE